MAEQFGSTFVLLTVDTVSKLDSWELFFNGRNRVADTFARMEENKFVVRISSQRLPCMKPGTFIISY
jgi:hypothetical protein